MRTIIFCLLTVLLLSVRFTVKAQDSLLSAVAAENVLLFNSAGEIYSGAGWDSILAAAKRTNNVLIGEDHFTNEIPSFVAAIAREIRFDNFFCELDPFTTSFLSKNIKTLFKKDLDNYLTKFSNGFSFYGKEPEYRLFSELARKNVSMIGTEQVSLFSDGILLNELYKISKSNVAKELYQKMGDRSRVYIEKFPTDSNKTFYMLTDEYGTYLDELEKLSLTVQEKTTLADIRLSRTIYLKQDHQLRISLMKKQLLEHVTKISTQKNLFKYGANHMCRGESFLRIYDLGNLVSNISDARFERSLHIMIVGKSGEQASGIPGMPAEKLDTENGDLKFLKPFYEMVEGSNYHVFQLNPIRRAYEKGELVINNTWLLRTIKGYDFLVIIPQVSAAGEL